MVHCVPSPIGILAAKHCGSMLAGSLGLFTGTGCSEKWRGEAKWMHCSEMTITEVQDIVLHHQLQNFSPSCILSSHHFFCPFCMVIYCSWLCLFDHMSVGHKDPKSDSVVQQNALPLYMLVKGKHSPVVKKCMWVPASVVQHRTKIVRRRWKKGRTWNLFCYTRLQVIQGWAEPWPFHLRCPRTLCQH